jgi:hypothetical protein
MRMSTPRNGLVYGMGAFGCLEPREFGCLDQPIATHLRTQLAIRQDTAHRICKCIDIIRIDLERR